MANLMDRGDSYRVGYLGTSMMMQVATGLGVLQKPLRELYVAFRQAGAGHKLQERHLVMTSNGMTMTFKDSPDKNCPAQEIFYSMPSILFWDAVQFVTVRGQTKKKKTMHCAFEPIDNDLSRNKVNLFSELEKKYQFLQQVHHPPIFTCVLRRTTGVKLLDVHAFVCSSDQEAIGLAHALHTVQENYTSDEVSETGVFGYNPFGRDSVRSTAGVERLSPSKLTAGPIAQPVQSAAAQSPQSIDGNRPGSQSQAHQRGPLVILPEAGSRTGKHNTGSDSYNSTGSNHSSNNKPGVYKLTQDDFQPSDGGTINASDYVISRSNEDDSVRKSKNNKDKDNSKQDKKSGSPQKKNDIYQYVAHIEPSISKFGGGAVQKKLAKWDGESPSSTYNKEPSLVFTSSQGVRDHHQQDFNSITKCVNLDEETLRSGSGTGESRGKSNVRGVYSDSSSGSGSGSRNWNTKSTQGSSGAREASKLGEGYSLLTGSQGAIPGQNNPRNFYGDAPVPSPTPQMRRQGSGSPTYQRTLPRGSPISFGSDINFEQFRPNSDYDKTPVPRRTDHGNSDDRSYLETPPGYRQNRGPSGGPPHQAGQRGLPRRELPPPPVEETRHFQPPARSPPVEETRHFQPPTRSPVYDETPGMDVGIYQPLRDRDIEPTRRSPLSPTRGQPSQSDAPVPVRPVAKVPPHMRTGIKVLPTAPVAPRRNSSEDTQQMSRERSNNRPKSNYFADSPSPDRDEQYQFGPPPRRSKSQYFNDPNFQSDYQSGPVPQNKHTGKPEANWQFRQTKSTQDYSYDGGSQDIHNQPTLDKHYSEKLLLNKKKDAEIAAVMQNMRFNQKTNSMNSGGTNFERSLGYFP